LAYGAGPVAKDIEGHKGGVDCQVDWQLSWFGAAFQIRADDRCDSLDDYDEYIAMDGGVHAIAPKMWPC
jgi:hypothetical protein